MAEGRSNQAIADTLVISERAVEKHVTGIFAKLNLAPGRRGSSPRAGSARLPRHLTAARFMVVGASACEDPRVPSSSRIVARAGLSAAALEEFLR